jgi:hypothetical protein
MDTVVKGWSEPELYRLSNLYNAPSFVKTAKRADLEPPENLPPEFFGDPRHRVFACHSRAATWLSCAEFGEKKATLGATNARMIEQRLLHAAGIHGITKECQAALEKVAARSAPETLAGLPDEDFADVMIDATGQKERHMLLRNSVETKRAADYLYQYRDLFPYSRRQQAAERILDKAAAFGCNLGQDTSFLVKTAGRGTCTAEAAVFLLRSRVGVTIKSAARKLDPAEPLDQLRIELLKLAQAVEDNPSLIRERDIRIKLAGIVDAYDGAMNLRGLVKAGEISRVEDMLFDTTEAQLRQAAAEHTTMANGAILRLVDLETIKIASVKGILGDAVAASLSANGITVTMDKAAAVLPTLDYQQARLFEQIMAEAGVAPAAREKAAVVKIERDYLLELANRT